MKLLLTVTASLFAATTLLGQQPGSEPAPSPTPPTAGMTAAEALPTPTPTPSLVDNLIKLWKANLSEDFLKKYISGADIAKDLSAEDIVKLRNAGLPESLISAVSERKQVVVTPTAAAVVTPAPFPAPGMSMRWEGLVRRNSGVVLFKSRWDPGVLEFKDETLRWTDAHDATKNVLLTAKQMTEHQLTCLKKPGGNECFEWVVYTKGQEYRFRDIAWERGDNAKVAELFTYFKSRYPNLVSSQVPVEQK